MRGLKTSTGDDGNNLVPDKLPLQRSDRSLPEFPCALVFLGTFHENLASSRDRDRVIPVFERDMIIIGPTLIMIVVVAVLVKAALSTMKTLAI